MIGLDALLKSIAYKIDSTEVTGVWSCDLFDVDSAFNKRPINFNDYFTNIPFIRMFALLCKYGQFYHYSQEMDDFILRKIIPNKTEDAKCIGNSSHIRNVFDGLGMLESMSKTPGSNLGIVTYAEGITSLDPRTLHAFNGLVNSNHNFILDVTWDLQKEKVNRDNIVYLGIEFDKDLKDWIVNEQRTGNSVPLPYLNDNGACCLTYAPLVNGKLDGYRMYESDYVELFGSNIALLDYFFSHYKKVYK